MHPDPSKLANRCARRSARKPSNRLIIQAKNRLTGPAPNAGRPNSRVTATENAQSLVSKGYLRPAKSAGTPLAIKGRDKGSAEPLATTLLQRGRRSTGLRKKDVENILAAGVFTAEEHRELNRFTTIHFEAARIADPVRALGQMMKLAGDWLRTKGAALTYIWVREAGQGKGDHAHILWHVPPALVADFARLERGWRKRIGAKPRKGAFKSKPVGLSYSHGAYQIQYGALYNDALAGLLEYVCKGANARAVEALGLSLSEPGGELWGKRCGISENIHRTARLRSAQ